MVLVTVFGAFLTGCASPAALQAQATEAEAEGASCSAVQLENYRELFDSVAEEAMDDVRLLHRSIEEDGGLGEVSAAARRAREREIALRRADIPQCLAFTHLKAIQSAQEMTQATEYLLRGDPQSAERLLGSSADHLLKAQRLLEQELNH